MLSECGFASAMNHPYEDPDFVFETEFENGDSETDDVTRRESKCSKLPRGKKDRNFEMLITSFICISP